MKSKIFSNGYGYIGISLASVEEKLQADLDVEEIDSYVQEHSEDRKTYHFFREESDNEIGFYLPIKKMLFIFKREQLWMNDQKKKLRKMFEVDLDQTKLNDISEIFVD